MADEPTGSKPADDQTQQPDVMPTQDETGTKEDPSVMPADQTPIIDDDPTIEKDGQKVVPFDSYKAEKEKRQELEKKLQEQQQQKPQATEQSTEETPAEETPDVNWEELLKQSQQPATQPTQAQPTQPTTQLSSDWVQQTNERIAEMRANGDEMGAYALLRQIETSYVNGLKRDARRWVKNYDELPLHTVTDEEVVTFQQNSEALRAILAKVKSGKGTTPQQPTPQPSNDGNNAQPADWQELIDKARQEGREETVRGLAASAGTTGEGTRAGTAPSGEVYELDEVGMDYVRKRGIPQEKWPEYAKLLQKENDMQGRY